MTINVNCSTVWGLILHYIFSQRLYSIEGSPFPPRRQCSLISGPGMSPCSYNCLVTCFSGKSRIFVPQVNDRGGVLWLREGRGAKDALPPRYELFLYLKVFLQDVLRRMLVR